MCDVNLVVKKKQFHVTSAWSCQLTGCEQNQFLREATLHAFCCLCAYVVIMWQLLDICYSVSLQYVIIGIPSSMCIV